MEEVELSYSQLYPEFDVVDNTDVPPVVVDEPKTEEAPVEEITLETLFTTDEQEVLTTEPTTKQPKTNAKNEVYTKLDGAIAGAKVIAKGFGLSEEVITQLESITDESDLVNFYEDLADGYKQHVVDTLKQEDPITEALLEFRDNGGNPLQLLDKFREQQDVLSLDLSTERNQKDILKQKYILEGLSPEKVEKKIDRLVALGEEALLEEAEDAKEFFSTRFEQERELMLEQQKVTNERIKQIEIQRRTLFEDKLKEFKVNKVEADSLKANAFQKVKMQSGDILPLWQAKAIQLQKNPEDFIDFVKYIEDPKKYKESLIKQGVTSNTVNVFKKTIDMKTKPDSVLDTSKPEQKRVKISFDK